MSRYWGAAGNGALIGRGMAALETIIDERDRLVERRPAYTGIQGRAGGQARRACAFEPALVVEAELLK
jgi:hypothetical protein